MTLCKCLRWAFRVTDWEPTRGEWHQILQSIQEEEVTRVNRFMFRDDSKSAAVGRIMIRAALSQLLHVPWSQIRLDRTEKGKPILSEPKDVGQCPSFNVSHDHDYVVLATDCGSACGVDVMKIHFRPVWDQKTVTDYIRSMKKQFSSTEFTTMEKAATDNEKLTLFYRYWCLKESYVKAIGTGIYSDLASLDFRFNNNDWSTSKPELWLHGRCVSDQWQFFEYKLGNDHVAAVCTRANSESHCRRHTGDHIDFDKVMMSDLLNHTQPLHDIDAYSYDHFISKSYKAR